MGKKLTDAGKWKHQRWFRLLPPFYKLALGYIEAVCDVDGTWQINVMDLIDDLNIPAPFNFDEFIQAVNTDYDKFTGQPFQAERIVRVDKECIWLTYYMSLQLESVEFKTINPKGNYAITAIKKCAGKGILGEGLLRGYIPLGIPPETLYRGLDNVPLRGLYIYIDKERDKEILETIYNSDLGDKKGGKGGGKGDRVPDPARLPEEPFTGAPPVSYPKMTAADFKKFEECLIADKIFVDPILMGHSIKPEDLPTWIKQYNAHIVAEKKINKDYDEYRRHFKNWIKDQHTKEGPGKHSKNGTTGKGTGGAPVAPVTSAQLRQYEKNKT